MSAAAERYRKIAATFTRRVREVPSDAWGNPAPPEGWDTRDVVRHLVEWIPAVWSNYASIELPKGPSVDDDPIGAWTTLSDGLQAMLEDPEVASREIDMPMGRMTVEQAVDMICTTDVFPSTPGTWPAPPASTRRWTPTRSTSSSWGWSPWMTSCAPAATTGQGSGCPTTPTTRPS